MLLLRWLCVRIENKLLQQTAKSSLGQASSSSPLRPCLSHTTWAEGGVGPTSPDLSNGMDAEEDKKPYRKEHLFDTLNCSRQALTEIEGKETMTRRKKSRHPSHQKLSRYQCQRKTRTQVKQWKFDLDFDIRVDEFRNKIQVHLVRKVFFFACAGSKCGQIARSQFLTMNQSHLVEVRINHCSGP